MSCHSSILTQEHVLLKCLDSKDRLYVQRKASTTPSHLRLRAVRVKDYFPFGKFHLWANGMECRETACDV
jgi:hypothetical protein